MTYIFEGKLNNQKPFTVRHLKTEDIHEILQLQETVVQSLENKEILQPLSIEEFQFITAGNGMIIGAYADGRLIAFRALLAPPVDEEGHLGQDAGLKDEELPHVIYQEISNVHPDYRGNRLQQKLAELIMGELAKQDHPYKYVCATVMPFNIPSLKDKLLQGMLIVGLKEKYDGRLRYIFFKELSKETVDDWNEMIELPMSDIMGQQQLLKHGWKGFKMEEHGEEYTVVFGK